MFLSNLTSCLLVLSLGHVTCTSLTLTASHARISWTGTPSFSMNCTADHIVSQGERREHLSRMRIVKHKDGVWDTVAGVDAGCKEVQSPEGLTGVYSVDQEFKEIHSLQVTWPMAVNETAGEYVCDVIGYSETGLPVVVRSRAVYVDVQTPLTLWDLLTKMEDSNERLRRTVATMDKTVKTELRQTQAQLQALSQRHCEKSWPGGVYALLQPESGCPADLGVTWFTGSRTFHTESSEANSDHVSPSLHAKKPYKYSSGTDNFMKQHFCSVIAASTNSSTKEWPPGSYCIMKYKSNPCPSGFKVGYIYWDDNDSQNKNEWSGYIPANLTDTNTGISYCCRNDSSYLHPIGLPRVRPFYLHRYGGHCQQVRGMEVGEEFMYFDADCCASVFKGFAPDGQTSLPDVKLHLCHYKSTTG